MKPRAVCKCGETAWYYVSHNGSGKYLCKKCYGTKPEWPGTVLSRDEYTHVFHCCRFAGLQTETRGTGEHKHVPGVFVRCRICGLTGATRKKAGAAYAAFHRLRREDRVKPEQKLLLAENVL